MLIGDRVRVDSQGHEDNGRKGWVCCVDSGALVYLETNDGDGLLGPFTRGELVEVKWCEWFVNCEHEATGTLDHPLLGKVPICDRCRPIAAGKRRYLD